jgi:hypothetical protein
MRFESALFLALAMAVCLISGCEPVLETGYKPHPLNATPAARQAYYAPAFTPEAIPDKKDDSDSGPGFGFGK